MYVDGITIRVPFCSLKRIEPKMTQDSTCQSYAIKSHELVLNISL